MSSGFHDPKKRLKTGPQARNGEEMAEEWILAPHWGKLGNMAEKWEDDRVFPNPLFGEPVVCTPDSLGFRQFRDFR